MAVKLSISNKKIVLKIKKDGFDMIRIVKGQLLKDIGFDENLLKETSSAKINSIIKVLSKQNNKTYYCDFGNNIIKVKARRNTLKIKKRPLFADKVILCIKDYKLSLSKLEEERQEQRQIALMTERVHERVRERERELELERERVHKIELEIERETEIESEIEYERRLVRERERELEREREEYRERQEELKVFFDSNSIPEHSCNINKEENIKGAVKLSIIDDELDNTIENEIMLGSLGNDMDDSY